MARKDKEREGMGKKCASAPPTTFCYSYRNLISKNLKKGNCGNEKKKHVSLRSCRTLGTVLLVPVFPAPGVLGKFTYPASVPPLTPTPR